MNRLFRQLLQLKEMRRESAYRALQTKRQDVRRAEITLRAAENALNASRASYSEQVDALYAPIIGQTTSLSSIEEVENRIAQLDVRHERLVEAVDDAADHLQDLRESAEVLASIYAGKVKSFDRFGALVEGIELADRAEMARLAEIEHEEGFINRGEEAT